MPATKQLSREQIAVAIEQLAERIAKSDLSFDIVVQMTKVEPALLELRHIPALMTLNRISMLVLSENKQKDMRYEFVNKKIEKLEPLDPAADSEALRTLANEIRNGN